MPDTPYSDLPPSAYWKTAMGDNFADLTGLYQPKWRIGPEHAVATYGSCFAQHFGRSLRARKFTWVDGEPAPAGLEKEAAERFGYGVFSARTANIYTPTLLAQWGRWAFAGEEVPQEAWAQDGRVYDPFRPRIEPEGFASEEEMRRLQGVAIRAFRRSIEEADVLVFTLGLTERWLNAAGFEYPMCPGTAAGTFDESAHRFDNLGFLEAKAGMEEAMSLFKAANPGLRFLLTVSPVPLVASASGRHVLAATMQSKAILRAVAGDLAASREDTDYFPSFEIIFNPIYGRRFFQDNLRGIAPGGVNRVMGHFFDTQAAIFGAPEAAGSDAEDEARADVICEEELLGSFGGRS
ncbi:GSCFA domain-containing protein [Pseudoroseicyclus tamaricis]|uniref:GSCFA domain-containing protein n=1 Tax=Pseudoroseicyclus tamaricis TaxID=2705421 RepID=A0A6B2JWC8_9RHOB|nr:GSCFA domain-containing protein [Pseudoroseicyclus tamaricis]NDV02215.1 GSCFA domain-containing protein [Pseudoroseicyclus tamaricis]